MADNVEITAGAGTPVATDDVAGVHYQRMKLVTAEDGASEPIGDDDLGSGRALWVAPRRNLIRVQQTPTISTTVYAAKDAIGGLLTFANAARSAGGSGRVVGLQIVDRDQERAAIDLVLFDRSITAPTDNAVFDPTDAELAYVVGVVNVGFGFYADFSDNAVANVPVDLPFVVNGTDLVGVLVARGTPTYSSTADLSVSLTIERD